MSENANRVISLPNFEVEESREWDPGFEGDRWVVVSRLGPFLRVFKRPPKYRKWFHHRTYNIPVRDWRITTEIKFLAGLCTLRANLEIRFQPTLRYAESNLEALPDLGEHIMSSYQALLADSVERELAQAEENTLINKGLENIEQSIEQLVNETLVAQDIQCRAHCQLELHFEDLSEQEIESMSGHFERQQAYLELIRKNHEFESKRRQEIFRHAEQNERAALEHQRNLLDQYRRDEAVRKAKEREESESIYSSLKEEESRQTARLASEEKRHVERLEHEKQLRKLELDAKRREQDMRLETAQRSEEILRREISILNLEKQRQHLAEDVEHMLRESREQKMTREAYDEEEADFAPWPALESPDKRFRDPDDGL